MAAVLPDATRSNDTADAERLDESGRSLPVPTTTGFRRISSLLRTPDCACAGAFSATTDGAGLAMGVSAITSTGLFLVSGVLPAVVQRPIPMPVAIRNAAAAATPIQAKRGGKLRLKL